MPERELFYWFIMQGHWTQVVWQRRSMSARYNCTYSHLVAAGSEHYSCPPGTLRVAHKMPYCPASQAPTTPLLSLNCSSTDFTPLAPGDRELYQYQSPLLAEFTLSHASHPHPPYLRPCTSRTRAVKATSQRRHKQHSLPRVSTRPP